MNYKNKAQGAIEYLLLLAAAIVVVAIVISFLSGTIAPVQDTGNRQLYESICNGPLALDNNSLLCGCYIKDESLGLGGKDKAGNWVPATPNNCPEKLDPKYRDDPLLDWNTDGA